MKANLELKLVHDGKDWVVSNDSITARGVSLSELDDDVKRALRQSGDYPEGTRLIVFMGFDFETFPTWLRQYHTHYFNRLVTIDM
ncbi:MAG: DUF5395 domain-containing protein [Gammaproteobacteria bacterium]|nr:MAG: DUF5395 domain-containing protein [Gammaproteobacteria bacterium]